MKPFARRRKRLKHHVSRNWMCYFQGKYDLFVWLPWPKRPDIWLNLRGNIKQGFKQKCLYRRGRNDGEGEGGICICPWYFPTLQRGGRSLHTFISFPEGAPPRTFLSLQRGRSLWGFSHSQRGVQFPYFCLLCFALFVLFKYGLPSGFEFKETRFHLYIMYFDRLNIISVLKEMKKIINIVKRSGRNPGSFQKAWGVKRKFGQIPVRAGANWKKPVGLKSHRLFWPVTFRYLGKPCPWPHLSI